MQNKDDWKTLQITTEDGKLIDSKLVKYELLPTKEDDERAERKAQIMNILKQAGTEQANFSCQSTVERYANKIMEVVE